MACRELNQLSLREDDWFRSYHITAISIGTTQVVLTRLGGSGYNSKTSFYT